MIYTQKQRVLMDLWKQNKLRRLNILEGSVSSGKTWISLVLWAFWVATMPQDKLYLMCGKSLTTLKRNCLIPLEELVGSSNFTFSLAAKEGYLFGRRMLLEGGNDARSESKIRGLTLQGAYCDELTLFPRDFFVMLLSRLRVPGAKLIATTNPDSPQHWLKTEYIDRETDLDLLDMRFTLDDNTTLDPDYVDSIKAEYTGVFYDRFILGRWKIAEGLVYPFFAADPGRYLYTGHTEGLMGAFYVSIDYGTHNPCSMGLWCVGNQRAIRIAESYYDSRKERKQRTDEEHYAQLDQLAAGRHIRYVVVDPSAASFIETIRRHGKFHVLAADNHVLNGIRVTAALMNAGRLLIHESCKASLEEFQSYCWDDKSQEDKVVKENDHAMDDIRYFANTVLAREYRWVDWKGV